MKTTSHLPCVLLASVLLLSGCAAFDPLPRDLTAAKKQIAIWVPDGTTASEAQRRMEERDFKCRVEVDPATRRKQLVCGISGPAFIPGGRWVARFEIEIETVTALHVARDFTGP